jgi:hypothetical protein
LTGRNAIPHGAGRRRGARAFVFGSRAHGVARPYSNLDLALKWTRPLGLDLLGQIAEALSESDLPYRVGRYTHRVAIANSRLVGLDDGRVSFTWKDYRQDGKTKVMTIAADEFIRRFLQHTVPHGFHRIRHIGFLANRHRTAELSLYRDLLAAPPPPDPDRRVVGRIA